MTDGVEKMASKAGRLEIAMAVMGVVLVVQLALVAHFWWTARRTAGRVAELEDAVASSGSEDLEDGIDTLALEIERLDDEIDGLRASSIYSQGLLKKMGMKVGDLEGTQADITDLFPELETMIDEKVEEKITVQGGTDLGRRPSIDSLATAFDLNEYQQARVSDLINDSKYEAYSVIATPRDDGTSILDDFTTAMLESDNPRQEGTKVMMKLLVEPVPGRDETYFEVLKEIQGGLESDVSGVMTEEQHAGWESSDVNLFGVDTGYSPLMEHFKTAMQNN